MKPPMAGWIGFAATMLLIVGGLTSFEGLIAIVREEYYVVTGDGVLLFDLTTWGWIMVFWGLLLFVAGVGLSLGSAWARWFAVALVSLNIFGQLGFVGNAQYPLWTLTVIALSVVVIYALTARWEGYPQEMGRIP